MTITETQKNKEIITSPSLTIDLSSIAANTRSTNPNLLTPLYTNPCLL